MDCDVVIIGSGPAGSATAYHLRDSGLNVVLIDRLGEKQFSRYHTICGSAVSSRGTKLLDLRKNEILNDISKLKIEFPGDRCLEIKVKGSVIDRPAVCRRLRSESVAGGVQFIEGSVISVKENDGKYEVILRDGTAIHSHYLVGADGAYSTVRKMIFGSKPKELLKVEELHSPGTTDPNTLEFSMSDHASQLYSWIFPYGDLICTGSLPTGKIPDDSSVKGIRTIPLGHVGRIRSGNALLIGDAAGMPNPMTAGGLSVAFDSAYHAAKSIISGHPESYQKWWDRNLASNARFFEVHDRISSFSDEELLAFAEHFNHKGIWINGISSVIHHPKYTGLYIGCLFSLWYGW